MNKDRKKNVYSDSSISEAATFYMSAIVKPILEGRSYRKASVPDYQHVEKQIAAIPRV